MKKYILLFLMVFQFGMASEKDTIPKTNAFKMHLLDLKDDDCDACGCSASGGSMGFASMLNSNFVGIRYFNQQYKSRNGLYSNSPWYNENYNTTQIWARVPVLKNIQVSALIPYHGHIREAQTGEQKFQVLAILP
jgi:hypothetical protein